LILDTKMSESKLTLRQLIEFQPETDREKEIYDVPQYILDDMNTKLEQGFYFLGGQIKMNYDDEINLSSFDKVIEINRKREAEYGGPCNSWEAISINQCKKILNETEKIVIKYFEIMSLRENS
jgi:hypothetical protein